MSRTDRVRDFFAAGFPLGAIGHFFWVGKHGLWYHFERPDWAPVFWYVLCALDFLAGWLLIRRPRLGLILGNAMMATTMFVNLAVFPSFAHGFNVVAVGITAFGIALACATPWLWRSRPLSWRQAAAALWPARARTRRR